MSEGLKTSYCISCGEDVAVNTVETGISGQNLQQCVHCGSFLGPVDSSADSKQINPSMNLPPIESPGEFHPDETTGGGTIMPDLPDAMDTPNEASGHLLDDTVDPYSYEPEKSGPPLETVITVEDSQLISAILNDLLIEEGLTKRVVPCKNGYEFLGRYIRERMTPHRIGLVVMDVKMPVLNGISAAVAMRAHETARDLEPVPIMFFTSKRGDETLRKVLMHCAPAMYINKGSSASPDQLRSRITKVVNQLMREEW